MKGWNVEEAEVVLPEGFSLEEEEDLLRLLYRGKEVGVFSSLTTPAAIEKAAEEHLLALQIKPGQ